MSFSLEEEARRQIRMEEDRQRVVAYEGLSRANYVTQNTLCVKITHADIAETGICGTLDAIMMKFSMSSYKFVSIQFCYEAAAEGSFKAYAAEVPYEQAVRFLRCLKMHTITEHWTASLGPFATELERIHGLRIARI